jgi:hypothetical protein
MPETISRFAEGLRLVRLVAPGNVAKAGNDAALEHDRASVV